MRSLIETLIDCGIIAPGCLMLVGDSSAAAQDTTTRFHHVHLLDRSRRCDKVVHGHVSGDIACLLFTHTRTPPHATLDSAIWHFGWGSLDMPADYAMHQKNGVKFASPLNTLPQGIVFAYMNGPDDALVEINSAPTRAFVHVHLYSERPLRSAEWYERHLGGHQARHAAQTG